MRRISMQSFPEHPRWRCSRNSSFFEERVWWSLWHGESEKLSFGEWKEVRSFLHGGANWEEVRSDEDLEEMRSTWQCFSPAHKDGVSPTSDHLLWYTLFKSSSFLHMCHIHDYFKCFLICNEPAKKMFTNLQTSVAFLRSSKERNPKMMMSNSGASFAKAKASPNNVCFKRTASFPIRSSGITTKLDWLWFTIFLEGWFTSLWESGSVATERVLSMTHTLSKRYWRYCIY